MHVLHCEPYSALYRRDPDAACLDPVDALQQYRARQGSAAARADRRTERMSHRYGDVARQAALHAHRRAPAVDILAD